MKSIRRPAAVVNATMSPRKSGVRFRVGTAEPRRDSTDAETTPGRAVLKDAEAVQFLRQRLGGLETHGRGGELLLMCAAIGPCQLCVVDDQRVLHSGNTARDVFERLALLGRRIEERSHETSTVVSGS